MKEQTILDRLMVWVWWLMVVALLTVSPFLLFSTVSECEITTNSINEKILVIESELSTLPSKGVKEVPLIAKTTNLLLVGLLLYKGDAGEAFPWQPRRRFKKWALARYREAQKGGRWFYWRAKLAYLLLRGSLPMASVVDLLTKKQLQRHLGALPVLYRLLEELKVSQIINRFCPTKAEIDHGTVAVVFVINRLHAPCPLWRITDWLSQTVLVHILGVPAAKFNDDRLARTLDALSKHKREIWLAISSEASLRFKVDKRFLFYDLTAFVPKGHYNNARSL